MDSRGGTLHQQPLNHPLTSSTSKTLKGSHCHGSRPQSAPSLKAVICLLKFPLQFLQNSKNKSYKVTGTVRNARCLISVLGRGSSVPPGKIGPRLASHPPPRRARCTS